MWARVRLNYERTRVAAAPPHRGCRGRREHRDKAHLARLDPRRRDADRARRRYRADRAGAGRPGKMGRRGVHIDVALALWDVCGLSPLQLEPENQAHSEAHRPREYLPAHRRHVHATRGAGAPSRAGHAVARARVGRHGHRHPVPCFLDRRATLALRGALSFARLGGGHVHARASPPTPR